MDLMRLTAGQIGHPPVLPPSLGGVRIRPANENRAAVLKEIGNPLDAHVRAVQAAVKDPYVLPPQLPMLADRLLKDKALDQLTARLLPDVADLPARINIALRLFVGYLDTAKTIAASTRAGPNSAATRQALIPIIESRTANDPIYRAGVEAAPHYKRRVLGEPIFLDGIPAGSIVLKDWGDEAFEGYIPPDKEATVDEMASDNGIPRRKSFEQYLEVLTGSCVLVEDLYFNVPLVTEITDKGEYKLALDYRERVYCYELYHHQRTLLTQRGLHKTGLLLNAETDKTGTIYKNWIGARKPDYVLHRPGEGTHNVGVTEVKPIAADLDEIKADMPKLKKFLDPQGMNYFGAVALIYGDQKGRIEKIQQFLQENFGNYWPIRFKALWHREPGSRPLIWDRETGRFCQEHELPA
jgi:hypothetical protein